MTTFMSVSARESSSYGRSSRGTPSTMPTEIAATKSLNACSFSVPFLDESRDGVVKGHVSPTYRRRARASVGLEDVAVNGDLHVREKFEARDRAKRSTDQTLDLLRPSGLFAPGRFTTGALGRRAGQHRVLGGHPSLAGATQPTRDIFFDRRGAKDDGATKAHEYRSGRHRGEVALETEWPSLIGVTPVFARCRHRTPHDDWCVSTVVESRGVEVPRSR